MEKHKVFVDVGGTSTRVWIHFADKPSPRHFLFPTHLHFLKNQIQKSLTGISASSIELFVGIRGVWESDEKNLWKKTLQGLASSVSIMSDVELTHHLAFGNSPGILLNAGTGSIAFGKAPSGKTARAGGLGPLLGDEGSGFWIGKEYLKKVFKKDGNLQKIRSFAVDSQAIPKIAGISQNILKKKWNKDPFLKPIFNEAHEHLKILVEDVVKNLNWKGNVPVKLAGGLFENQDFREGFIKNLRKNKSIHWVLERVS